MKKNSYLTVTDQFCGAGGSSEGVVQVARKKKFNNGLQVKMALNHWKLAIETHNTNHPETDHDCTDISACDPRRYPSTDILITSPECTNHSLAKGTKRKHNGSVDMFIPPKAEEERSRATMWDVPRFAEYHKYRIIIVENVVDARYWIQFPAWLHAMQLLGYDHECVYLNSMHTHPTPQSRDRMYVVFWQKGNKRPDLAIRPKGFCNGCLKETETFQSWKNSEKKSGKYRQQYIFRCPTCNAVVEPYYYAAFNAIDWSIPGTRISDRTKPLSENTMKRIRYGIDKYWHHPQIITTRYSSGLDCRVKDATSEVLPTQPGDQSHAILNPIVINTLNSQTRKNLNNVVRGSIDKPLSTQTTIGGLHILSPIAINAEHDSHRNKKVRDAAQDPAFTQTTRAINSVVMPFIVENNGTSKARSINERLGCITTTNTHALLSPESLKSFMAYNYNGSHVVNHVHESSKTFSTKQRASLITMGEIPKIEDCNYRMLLPHEIKSGMAFRSDYKVLGNSRDQVKQLGNAVTPPAMELLVERCIETLL